MKDRIVSKIQKLLARTQSNYAAEAESALLKAQELMVQHGLSLRDVQETQPEEAQNVEERGVFHSQAPMWHGRIARILADNFRCHSIWLWQYRAGRNIRVITFIGLTDDVQIVTEAYSYAISLVRFNLRCIKKRRPRITTGYLNTYIDGFISGLNAKFREQVDRQQWGLVLVKDKEVVSAYEAYDPTTITPKGRAPQKNNNPNAYHKGYIDGKSFDPSRKRIEK